MVDTDLVMDSDIDSLLSKIRPQITTILRTRGYHRVLDLITQFKNHIWVLMEAHMAGIFHAVTYHFAKIDRVQNRFLHELAPALN